MKKIVILLMFIITYSNVIGQNLSDFRSACQVNKVEYDEDFNPIITFVFQNIANKTITTIEVVVVYYSDTYAPTSQQSLYTEVLHASIAPNQNHAFTIRPGKDRYNRKPQELWFSRVRYSDGSICDH